MPQFAVWNVEDDSVFDFCPLGVVRQEQKLRIGVNKFFDEPRAGDSIYFNFLASDPFHKLQSCLWHPGSGTRSLLLYFMARIKFSPGWQPIALAKGWEAL